MILYCCVVGFLTRPPSSHRVANSGSTGHKTTPNSVQLKSSTLPSNRYSSSPKSSKSPKKKKEPTPVKQPQISFYVGNPSQPHMTGSKRDEKGRVRRSSFSKMQERLRRRLSRNIKSKEVPVQRERPSTKYWSSSHKSKALDGVGMVDARLTNLARTSSTRHGPPKTVSGQFQASLLSLVERLEMTNPHFVRCIKSNGEKVCVWCVCVCARDY